MVAWNHIEKRILGNVVLALHGKMEVVNKT